MKLKISTQGAAAILISIFIAACGAQKKNNKLSDWRSYDTSRLYFPQTTLKDSSKFIDLGRLVNVWYSKQLSAMKEPVLFKDKSGLEIYRFTWLRTFHNPVAIRIVKDTNSYAIFWKQASGQGGYEPGELKIDRSRTVDKNVWDEFKSRLNEIQFWTLPTNQKEKSGFDGAQWILEGKVDGQYHVVDKWTPDQSTAFYQICNFLITLTDLEIPEKEKY